MLSIFPLRPELISIHIPKTAGSTFHAVLKQHYGWQLKHLHKREDFSKMNSGKLTKTDKPLVKAIHGHFKPHKTWKDIYPDAKWICWLRDPAERVISAYFHLKKTANPNGDINQQTFHRLNPSFQEFVTNNAFANQLNVYQRMLGGVKPEDFFFVGRTEYFNQDLARLSEKMSVNFKPIAAKNVGVKNNNTKFDKNELQSVLLAEYDLVEQYNVSS